MGKRNLKALRAGIEAADKRLKHVIEFGVYRGHTLRFIRKQFDRSYKVFGFDSFEGLPEDWIGAKLRKGYFGVEGKVPEIDGVTFYKGWFSETIPEYLKVAKPIGLIHVDCDLYVSTKEALFGLNEYIAKNTIIVFDEWFYNHDSKYDDEEQRAFWEWVKERKFDFIDFPGCKDLKNEKKIVRILS